MLAPAALLTERFGVLAAADDAVELDRLLAIFYRLPRLPKLASTDVLRACIDAQTYATRIDNLVDQWRTSLGAVRNGSAVDLLLDVLPGVPLMTVDSAAGLIDRSDVAAGGAINRLVAAGILTQRNVGKQRYRIFEAPAVLDLFTSLERALASPAGNTGKEPPVRPMPQRPAFPR